jgi:oligopeptidase A
VESNPLLQIPLALNTLPAFSQIKPEHIKPAISQLIERNRQAIKGLLDHVEKGELSISWTSFVEPIEKLEDGLNRAWSPVSHMNAVVNSDALREAYESCLPLISEYSTWIGQNKRLYDAYEVLANCEDLDETQQKIVKDSLRDFKLAGVALSEQDKKRYGEIKTRLSELSNQFSNHVLDATMAWSKDYPTTTGLEGLPDSALAMAKSIAKQNDIEGYRLTLDIPCYIAVVSYAEDQNLREEMYTAYATRASDQGPHANQFDNSALIDEILDLKQELAQLLDFDSYADLSLVTKMAESTTQVVDFLEQLAKRSKPQAQKELDELKAFAQSEYGVEAIQPWDISFYSEKLRQHRYAISQEALRPYFPEDKVLSGLYSITENLFDVSIKERRDVDVWHPSVKYFDIFDNQQQKIASFFIDLYARQHKRGGAWMDVCLNRMQQSNGEVQLPVAYLNCNFSSGVDGKPGLLTHDEVTTLFHEFGHGLHHMLTKVNYSDVSGINGVAWDAVELPSQFMENFCFEDQALDLISGHWQTGESLPADMRHKMLAAKNFQSAMQMVRQLEFSLFDFAIHAGHDNQQGPQVQTLLSNVREKVAVIVPPSWHRFQHSFSHIFAGGYAAGYYSYKWAEVLSADAFSKFEEEGVFNPQAGLAFKHNILEMGGSKEPMELFVAFRGRKPEIDALLRHSGIGVAA